MWKLYTDEPMHVKKCIYF